jgi:hypothetical protein
VTVGAEQDDVLETVIGPVAVDVVELHAQRLPQPLADAALFALVLLETFVQYATVAFEIPSRPLIVR